MKHTMGILAGLGLLAFSTAAFADLADYNNNPGRQQAQSHTAPGCNPGFTGAGAGGFGFLSGQGNNHQGGRQGEANDNPVLCGNANENAFTRGGQNQVP
jgi:hypothetical protein